MINNCIIDRIERAKTSSALGGLAAEIVSAETINLVDIDALKKRMKYLNIDNVAKDNYDYAMALADSAGDLEFEEVFKFYSLYEAIIALAFLNFDNALEYKEKLTSKDLELLKLYSSFRKIKSQYMALVDENMT